VSSPAVSSRIEELLAIMERLRAPDGCPWDREQTFASIAPYTIEEAYEVADAIEREDLVHLKDELGDLLFQVVFHAQIARERGAFDFEAAAGAICDKLVRRHPHVFAGEGRPSAAEQSVLWENIKAEERGAAEAASALDGVPRALPALMRAHKLSKRAARVGFDFEHASQTADKVAEELAEVREAAACETADRKGTVDVPQSAGPSEEIFEEIGDLLFAAANLARKLDVDAEAALRAANAKFERRFRAMEELAQARGEVFSSLSLAAQEALWLDVKRAE
jgi:nucleoside triphosphate diphosphatase